MIILTFEEYDKMMEQSESKNIPKNYDYPSIEEIKQKLLIDESYLTTVLSFIHYPKDNDYYKQLNTLLTDMIYLTDDEKEKIEIPQNLNGKIVFGIQDIMELTEKVKQMPFQCTNWYPNIKELRKYTSKSKQEDIAFLLWLINTPMELSKDEEFVREYAQKLLKEKIAIM